MKKMIASILCAVPLLYSCTSVPKDLAQYTPVAIMTVYGNPAVPLYNEITGGETVEDGILSGAVNRMINKKNPENETAQERIDYASALLSQRMRDFGLQVIDPSVLKECTAYKNAGKDFLDYLGNTVPAAGYDAITSSNGKLNRMMCAETGAKSALYVKFRFQKVMAKEGVHDKGVAARLVMTVFATDANGKALISREYKAVSADYVPLVKTAVWDKEKVMDLYPDLVNRVVTEFLSDYALTAGGDRAPDTVYTPTAIKIKAPSSSLGEASSVPEDSAADAVLAEKRATAKKLLERGMSATEAAEITGLSVEDIQNMQ